MNDGDRTMELRIGICDEDSLAVNQMEEALYEYRKENEDWISVKAFTEAKELISYLESGNSELDLILMDTEPGGEDGIKLCAELMKLAPYCDIAFCTNYPNAVNEFNSLNHCYYIMKKCFREKLPVLLSKLKQGREESIDKIVIHTRGSKELVHKSEIQYLERDRKITYVYTKTEVYKTPEKLQDILERLGNRHFIRCHNSFVINFRSVKSYSRKEFGMDNEVKIPISRTYIDTVKEAFSEWVRNWL